MLPATTMTRRRRLGVAVTATPASFHSTPDLLSTARDQVGALLAGTHRRCGAGCWLSIVGCSASDGSLVVRLVWSWLMDNSRFYCAKWFNEDRDVMISFGVSSLLLTLTHEMAWWAEGDDFMLLGASVDFLVLVKRQFLCLQDRATGQRVPLFDAFNWDWDYSSTNGKWLVLCHHSEMVVVEVPRKNRVMGVTATIKIKKPTVVQTRWKYCGSEFVSFNENYLLLHDHDHSYKPTCSEIALVDLEKTCASGKLEVLSSAVIRKDNLPAFSTRFCLEDASYFAFRRRSDAAQSFLIEQTDTPGPNSFLTTAGRNGESQIVVAGNFHVSQLTQSQFCVFSADTDEYYVYDLNEGTNPARRHTLQSGCMTDQAFVEGGLLFQMSESRKEVHVTEESSGSHVVTFNLFRPLVYVTHHFSFPLFGSP
ncbi:hypothetical protein Pelo_6832 [Pelomyxa schiedti]|nr:hypothetical protein Pelo_6832 [Pelomyxa schiedti]